MKRRKGQRAGPGNHLIPTSDTPPPIRGSQPPVMFPCGHCERCAQQTGSDGIMLQHNSLLTSTLPTSSPSSLTISQRQPRFCLTGRFPSTVFDKKGATFCLFGDDMMRDAAVRKTACCVHQSHFSLQEESPAALVKPSPVSPKNSKEPSAKPPGHSVENDICIENFKIQRLPLQVVF